MKKILFHSLTIPPDNVSTGNLVAEIASKFKETKLNIEILHQLHNIILMKKPFLMDCLIKKGKNKYVSNYKNVKINHLSSSKDHFSRKKRFFQWINYHYQINYF